MNRRRQDDVQRGERFEINVDGEKIVAYEGETIATALVAAGKRICNTSNKNKEPRGMYCGIGVCMRCRMIVNETPGTLVCQTLATPDCKVQTQIGLENWGAE